MTIEPLLALPAHRRARLLSALSTGALTPPYSALSLRPAIGPEGAEDVRVALSALAAQGLGPMAVALAVEVADAALAKVDRPELVWSGPEVAGVHARDTRPVFEELVGSAQHSIWISTYAYYDGKKAFHRLAQRLDAMPSIQANLLLNIQRKPGDTSAIAELVSRFADKLWLAWPGERRPAVFYDPSALAPAGPSACYMPKRWWSTIPQRSSPQRTSQRRRSTATSNSGCCPATARSPRGWHGISAR